MGPFGGGQTTPKGHGGGSATLKGQLIFFFFQFAERPFGPNHPMAKGSFFKKIIIIIIKYNF